MTEPAPPIYDDLVADLKTLRREGIKRLRHLDLPALTQAVRACGHVRPDGPVEAPAIEVLVRAAVADLGDSRYGEVAAVIYGLTPGTRGDDPPRLRQEGAGLWGVGVSRFRHGPEPAIIEQVAELILARCHEHALRTARLEMERKAPVSSRLAVHWVERFEAYYRIWSPVFALGADLTAYRGTLLEDDRPYDQEPTEDEPEGYSQELQAAGYGSDALYHFTNYLVQLDDFMTRHGGLWLLSDEKAEQEAADAVYNIRWHSPMNERDDSYLRRCLRERARGELHDFRTLETDDPVFADTHHEWQQFLSTCACTWSTDTNSQSRTYFRTARTESGIDPACQVHAIIQACNDYCTIIDADWDRIADWYHIHGQRPISESAEAKYRRLREQAVERGQTWPPWSSA